MASRKKQSATGRKRDGIHFVNARPSSETERLKAQRLVRAHVGRWISDQTKDRSNALDASSNPSLPASHPLRDSISPIAGPSSSDLAGPSSYTLVSRPSPPGAVHRANVFGPAIPVAFDDQARREWRTSPFAPSQASDSSDSSDDASIVTIYSNEPAAIIPWQEIPRIEPQITGVFDPFCTYPSQFSPDVVNSCETYCLSR